MPLKSYAVLKGQAKARCASQQGHPHYHLWITAGDRDYRATVNVRSLFQPSQMEYLLQFRLWHPLTKELSQLESGLHRLDSQPGGLALDFIRLNLFHREQMTTLPCDGPDCPVDLSDVMDGLMSAAIADPECRVYVFGEPWEDEATDRIFRFFPSRGMHEVHMNQGNDPYHWEQDGAWQDGAVLIEHPRQKRWAGLFLKFQSQSWHTDDRTGHALPLHEGQEMHALTPGQNGRHRPDGAVRIIAAMVHSRATPPRRASQPESVTLLNVCPYPVNVDGWTLANRFKAKWRLRGCLAPGEVREIPLGAKVPLGNQGGIITLLNREGLKVHGVSYTAEEAAREGWRIAF